MEVLTIEEVAEVLKISAYTVRQYLREGKLPGRKVGRHWRILRQDLERFLRSRTRKPQE